jgi:phosphoglycolate phosphatase
MIGDSRVDIAAGKAAGIATCGFTGGFRGRTELQEAGADYLIDEWIELRSIVTPAR